MSELIDVFADEIIKAPAEGGASTGAEKEDQRLVTMSNDLSDFYNNTTLCQKQEPIDRRPQVCREYTDRLKTEIGSNEIRIDAFYAFEVLANLYAEEVGYVVRALLEKVLTGHNPGFEELYDCYGEPLNRRLMLTAYDLLYDSIGRCGEAVSSSAETQKQV